MGDFNGRSIGWLVVWLVGACVFLPPTSNRCSWEAPEYHCDLSKLLYLGVHPKIFSHPFISPREQGAFVFPSRKCNIGTYVDVGGTLSRLPKVILL